MLTPKLLDSMAHIEIVTSYDAIEPPKSGPAISHTGALIAEIFEVLGRSNDEKKKKSLKAVVCSGSSATHEILGDHAIGIGESRWKDLSEEAEMIGRLLRKRGLTVWESYAVNGMNLFEVDVTDEIFDVLGLHAPE